jgi:hypothetical protein
MSNTLFYTPHTLDDKGNRLIRAVKTECGYVITKKNTTGYTEEVALELPLLEQILTPFDCETLRLGLLDLCLVTNYPRYIERDPLTQYQNEVLNFLIQQVQTLGLDRSVNLLLREFQCFLYRVLVKSDMTIDEFIHQVFGYISQSKLCTSLLPTKTSAESTVVEMSLFEYRLKLMRTVHAAVTCSIWSSLPGRC